MKKVLLIILISFLGRDLIGQAITKRAGASVTVNDENLFVGKSFRVPVFTDTTAANAAVTLDSSGKLIFTYDVNGLWIRQCSPKKWVRVGSGSGSGGGIVSLGNVGNYGLILVNDSTYRVDTLAISTRAWRQKGMDSLLALIGAKVNISDTAAMLLNYWRNGGNSPSTTLGSIGNLNSKDLSLMTKGVERLRLDTNGRTYVKRLLNIQNNTYVVDTLYSFGTSIPNGEIVGLPSAYPSLIADNYQLELKNLAISGSGWLSSLIQQSTYMPLTHNGMSMTEASINSVRLVGLTQGGYNQNIVTKKVFTTNHWLRNNMQAAGNGDSVTRTGGGWIAPYAAQSGYYTRTNATALSTATNDSIMYNFTDSTVIFGFESSSNTVANFTTDMEVYLDGVLQYHYNSGNKYSGVSDGVYNNAWGQDVLYFTGLAYGHHRLKLVNKTSNFMMVDYFGHFRTDLRQKPVIFDIEQCTWYGFNSIPSYTNASTAIVNYYNQGVDSLVTAFPQPYRPIIVHENATYDTATMIYPDGVHPNVLGHQTFATAGINAIGAVNSISLDSNDVANINGNLYFYSISGLQKIALENSNAFIQNTPASQQAGSFNISGNNTTSYIADKLTVGKASLINTKTSLQVITGTNINLHILGATGDMDRVYVQSASDDRLTLKPLWIQGSQVNINSNLFNATPTNIGIGTTNVYTDSKLEIGQDANTTLLPYQSQLRLSGFSNPSLILNIGFDTLKRAGFLQAANNPSSQLPIALNPQGGSVSIGKWAPSFGLDINRKIGVNKDSIPISTTNLSALSLDTTTGQIVRAVGGAVNLGNSDLTQSSSTRQYTIGYNSAAGQRYLSLGKLDASERTYMILAANSTNHNGAVYFGATDSTSGVQTASDYSPTSQRIQTAIRISGGKDARTNYYLDSLVLGFASTNYLTPKKVYNFGADSLIIKGNMGISASSADSVLVRGSDNVVVLRAQSDLGGGLLSGTYTPTLTNVANVAASTAYSCQYSRVGTVVTVSGEVDIDPTTTLTLTQLGISLPIASNLTDTNELGGTSADDLGTVARVAGDATNNRAELRMTPTDVTNRRFSFTFTYRIL